MEVAIDAVVNADAKDRVQAGAALTLAFEDSGNVSDGDAARLLAALTDWVKSNNFKVAIVGIELVKSVVTLAPSASEYHVADIATALRDKAFSDTKEQVRDSGLDLTFNLMEITSPQEVWDVMASGLKHKLPRVKEYSLKCFGRSISKFGVSSLRVGPHLSTLGLMVADRDENVREAAVEALVEVYRHVGNRLRRDLNKLDGIPATKLSLLNDLFDEMVESGNMVISDENAPPPSATSRKSVSRGMSAVSRKVPAVVGVSMQEFNEAMASGSKSPVYAGSESALESEFAEFRRLLSDDRADWERRVQTCKRMRSLIEGDALQYGSFNSLVFDSATTLAAGVKDLRSQVSKEACITVAKISEIMGAKFEPSAKIVVPALFTQCLINVKVLADSADLALKHVIRTCQNHRILALIFDAKQHKAVAVRKAAYGSVHTMLSEWDPDVIKKALTSISDMILAGQSDADSAVRQIARASFWRLEGIFPTTAATIMGKLDQSKMKILNKEKSIDISEPQPRQRYSSIKRHPKKASSPEPLAPMIDERDRRTPPRRDPLNSSGPLRVKTSTGRESSNKMEPQRVRPATVGSSSGSSTNHDLNRSGPRRVGVSSAKSASSSGAARRVAKPPQRVREPTLSEQIAGVAELARSHKVEDKLECCNEVHNLLHSGRIANSNVGKIADVFIDLLDDTDPKVIAAVADGLSDFIVRFRDIENIGWIRKWTIGLVSKQGMNLIPLVQEKVSYALDLLRGSYDAATQIVALFEILANHSELQSQSAKLATMEHMQKILPDYDSQSFHDAYSSNALDCLSGIQRMAEFVDVNNPDLRRYAANNLLALFRIDPAMFAEMLSRWPSNSLKLVRKALDIALPNWESELANRSSRLNHPASSTEAFDLAVSMDDLGMGLDDEMLEPEDPSDALGYNPDMYRDYAPSDPSSVGHSPEPRSSPLPTMDDHVNGNVDDIHIAGPDEYRSDMEIAVESAISSYTNGIRDTPTMIAMLQIFQQASKEDTTVWDSHFDAVLEIVLDLMDHETSAQVRDDSLRNLRQMLKSQTQYFGSSIDLVVRKLLERHRETERDVLRSAEETLSVLSNTVAAPTCALILKPIISNESGAVLLAAIKLLTKILKKLSPAELSTLTVEIVPGLIQGYKHPLAEVRKGVVFALVEMYLVLGDELNVHLGELSSSQRKLLGIYIKRAEEKLRDGAL